MKITKANYTEQVTPTLKFISDDQIYEIHMATLEVLERVGVRVDEAEALEMLKQAGAYVEGSIVKIPPFMVKKALQSAPPRVVLATRDGERKLFLEKNRSYYGLGSDLPYTIDLYSGERRPSTKQDVANASRLLDALPNFDFMMSFAIATDVSKPFSYLHQFEAMVTNTRKSILITARDKEDLLQIFEMAAAITGGYEELKKKPFLALYVEPISPLAHSRDGVQKLLACAEFGVPAVYTPGMGAGANGPCTLIGLITQANAELLSGLVIHQLKRQGAPFIYGGCPGIMDMKTTTFPYGCPEWHMGGAILSQMARFYELPVFSTGGCSDAIVFDQQAGLEIGYSLLLAQLSGANLIHDVGYMESGLTGSLESMVVCDEAISMMRRIGRGFEVNRETLAVEVMERVGPGGNYFMDEHTYKHFKHEFWMPELLNRKRYDDWKASGSLTLGEKAKAKAKKILEEYEPVPLAADIKEKLAEIIARAEENAKSLKNVI